MRITDFPELVTATGNDLLVTVDIANDLTKKIKLENLPISIATTVALATKQNLLVSGTNIKTINSTSLLGSGDITIAANPSGVSGAIQFSNVSAFASDAANLFWDDTNKRLGVGTNAPTENVEVVKNAAANNKLLISNTNTTTSTARATVEVKVGTLIGTISSIAGSGVFVGSFSSDRLLLTTGGTPQANIQVNGNFNFGNSINDLGAKVGIKGSGSTSATTSLLVQNSAGTGLLTLKDNGDCSLGGSSDFGNISGTGCFFRFSLAVGTLSNATASAILQADSTTRGFLPPRMTTTQKNAISSPAAGLVVYDNTTNKLQCYNGSTWNDLF
jgi:hypothetical protein